MDYNDFRYMRRGKPLDDLKKNDFSLLEPIRYRGINKQRALLLLHGFTSSPAVFRYLIPQVRKNYDALICPALPGHAQSIAAFAQTKASDWLLSAGEECRGLFNEYEKVDILGLSLGALLACQLSLSFSFNHMFLLAPALKLKMNINKNTKWLNVLKNIGFCELRNLAGNLVTPIHAELSYRRLPIPTLIELFAWIHQYHWVAPTCPIDLFLGAHDDVVDSTQIEKMFSALPHTHIHWLAHSAHVLPLDNDLDCIVRCIKMV